MTHEPKDLRRFGRIPFAGPVLLSRGKECWQTSLMDISLKGMLVEAPSEWSPPALGSELDAEVVLHGIVRVRMTVKVMRLEAGRVACEWSGIDVESLSHLRRILELNGGQSVQIDSEIHALSEI